MRSTFIIASLLMAFNSFAQVIDGPLDFLGGYPILEKKIQEMYSSSKIDLHHFTKKTHRSYPSIKMLVGEYRVDREEKSRTAYYLVTEGATQFSVLGGYKKLKDECYYDISGNIQFLQTSSDEEVNDFMRDICRDIIGEYKSQKEKPIFVQNDN